ncbi:MAG: ATP-dependent dethiobiotin synthetase BioD [Alphaproteobacteria bacterium]|nr:ATP-dependent dethiobiotin synthetase BioD [Alphaproteobacteria bacterium]
MSNTCIITGTDTDVGKTVFAAMLMLALEAYYWKPIQCGVEDGVDTRTVQNLTKLPEEYFFPEKYIFTEPLSPHRAAEIDGAEVDVEALEPPACGGPLLIEGAGGLMVPLTRKNLQINLFKRWNLPVILCARTGLGTINHTLLSVEALWSRKIPIHGIAFVGEDNPDTIETIAKFSGVKVLGRLPWLYDLSAENLKKAFKENFSLDDFITVSSRETRVSA